MSQKINWRVSHVANIVDVDNEEEIGEWECEGDYSDDGEEHSIVRFQSLDV